MRSGFINKAMVVSIDKATALRMHDKVRKHWAVETERVQKELGRLAYLLIGEAQAADLRAQEAELKRRPSTARARATRRRSRTNSSSSRRVQP